jgi:hypothetical protein
MTKKCNKCGVPLEGLGYKLIARPIFGIKPGRKKSICNKCEKR